MPVDSLQGLRDIPNLAKVVYSCRNGTCFEGYDIKLGKFEIQHVDAPEMDLYVGKAIVYKSAVMDVIYFENNDLDVSRYVLDGLHRNAHLRIQHFDVKGRRASLSVAPYCMTRAVPTAYTVYEGDKPDWSKSPLSGWLVTWSAVMSYLPGPRR